MAKKPFPFSVCEQCCSTGGGGGNADLTDYVTKEELEAKGYSTTEYVNTAINAAIGEALEGEY